jgi:hypothetical protein
MMNFVRAFTGIVIALIGCPAFAADQTPLPCKVVLERGIQEIDRIAVLGFVTGRQVEKTSQCMSYVRLDTERSQIEAVKSIARTVCGDQDLYGKFHLRALHQPAKLIEEACKIYPELDYFEAIDNMNRERLKGSW